MNESHPQVSLTAWVCFNEVNPLREQHEYAVREALRQEREAWSDLERAARPNDVDEALLRRCRERWQAAARVLVRELRSLKG